MRRRRANQPGRKTLVLSASYVPVRIISWRDAIKMRCEDTADVVAEYRETVSSPSVTWRIPAVIRERQFHKGRAGVRFSPLNVFRRDGYRCQYCGDRFPPDKLECEHVVPKSKGGKRNWENIVAACRTCNARKRDRSCEEIGMFPLAKPVRPKSLPVDRLEVPHERAPEEWLAYL